MRIDNLWMRDRKFNTRPDQVRSLLCNFCGHRLTYTHRIPADYKTSKPISAEAAMHMKVANRYVFECTNCGIEHLSEIQDYATKLKNTVCLTDENETINFTYRYLEAILRKDLDRSMPNIKRPSRPK